MCPIRVRRRVRQRRIGTGTSRLPGASSAGGRGPPVAQSSNSTVCTMGIVGPRSDLHHAADIAGRDDVGLRHLQRLDLARLQLPEISGCIRL
jgi:hypothetical protein